ncbi:MAG: hypothetical protein V1781_01450 [Bacteroidota bacterium]
MHFTILHFRFYILHFAFYILHFTFRILHFRAVPKIDSVIATARQEAGSNLYFYIKKQIASVVPPSQ